MTGFRYVGWTLYLATGLVAALYLAWEALTRVDFLYPQCYELVGIDETIAVYGPRNRHRRGFETTTKAERVRLFSAIVRAIHDRGSGLGRLVYHAPDGRPIAPLLTPPEILHLQDVARLIDVLRPLGQAACGIWLALCAGLAWRLALPPFGRALWITTLVLAAGGMLILLLGPVTVFYRLHVWTFPPGHPWFFYYQDSLLTTLLKAPAVFGCIAPVWAALSVGFFAAMLWAAHRLQRLRRR